MAGNTISDAGIARLQRTINDVDGLLQSPERGGVVRGYQGPDWFLARITGWSAIVANSRWKYAWQEVLVKNDANGIPQVVVKAGGRSGTVNAFWALNQTEMNNVADHAGTQGNSINQAATNYPAGFHLLPVGGGSGGVVGNMVVVRMTIITIETNTALPLFEYQNADQGPCT